MSPDEPIKIAVKRDGPRGWHYIARAHFDPKVHEVHQLDPLDGDSDGRRGGDLTDEVKEAQAALKGEPVYDPRPAPAKPKRRKAKK